MTGIAVSPGSGEGKLDSERGQTHKEEVQPWGRVEKRATPNMGAPLLRVTHGEEERDQGTRSM